ncbi:chemotaxis regulator CheZ [mine drainage metagenome]|uniref:Protein phosphatase CheZ n=1 Tax=mine drainage metagenome TaxID=410659 RepID=A0A1J5R2D8_9ZZZZ
MTTRKKSAGLSQSRVEKIGEAASTLHRLLKDLGHAKGLQQSAATMPDARERLSFIDQTMHDASEKTISAVENSLPLTDTARSGCADLARRLADAPDLAHHALVQEAVSQLGEIASSGEILHHNLLQIMEAQEFRDVAGQMVNKIVTAAEEIEKILLDLLREYAPKATDSLILNEGLMAGPAHKTDQDGVSGQDEVDDLLSSMGF